MPQNTASNIKIQDTQSFDESTGKPVTMRNVTFMVGNHGPFRLTDKKDALDGATIKRLVQQQVDEVNDIESIQSPGN